MKNLINRKVTVTRGDEKGMVGTVVLQKDYKVFIKGIRSYKQFNKKKNIDRTKLCYIHISNLTLDGKKISKL